MLSLSDKIQIASIIASSIISIVSVTIAVLTLKQSNKISIESNRANIVFLITKNRTDCFHSLTLKNYGKSCGKLLELKLNPELSFEKSIIKCNLPLLTQCKNIYLAPNQSISSNFPFEKYPDKKFDVTITYETLGKTYTNSYTLDLNFIDISYTITPHKEDLINPNIKKVSESILEVADKLFWFLLKYLLFYTYLKILLMIDL